MSLPVPAMWELVLVAVSLVLIAIGALVRGRAVVLRWPFRLTALGVFAAALVAMLVAPTALIAQAPLAPVAFHPTYVQEGTSVHLTIYDEKDGGLEAATLSPAYIALPAHARVTVTIVNFDTRPSPPAAPYTRVTGTVGGVMTVNGTVVRAVSADRIAHTVTVPALGLNLPVPVASPGHPARVVATITTPASGTYEWLCMCPCGMSESGWGYPMEQAGMMRGQIRVD